jgi:hypothetical protein
MEPLSRQGFHPLRPNQLCKLREGISLQLWDKGAKQRMILLTVEGIVEIMEK